MWFPMYWPTKICWCWVDIIFLEMLWLWAVFANEYMFLYPLQSMQLFANCCWYCKLHISGSNLHLRGRLYSHVFIYLDFEVYKYFITIYCYVSRYKQNDLLVMWYCQICLEMTGVDFSTICLQEVTHTTPPCHATEYLAQNCLLRKIITIS